jgi:hypothetical protein
MAEGEGFEPPEPFRVQWFSRPPPSTTRPSLRVEITPEFASLDTTDTLEPAVCHRKCSERDGAGHHRTQPRCLHCSSQYRAASASIRSVGLSCWGSLRRAKARTPPRTAGASSPHFSFRSLCSPSNIPRTSPTYESADRHRPSSSSSGGDCSARSLSISSARSYSPCVNSSVARSARPFADFRGPIAPGL